MTLGITVGKFYPFHMGHDFLIKQAKAQVDKLVVIVSYKPEQVIRGEIRANWIQEMHPDVEVILGIDDLPANKWDLWSRRTFELLKGRQPDIVFTSEVYGDDWAQSIGCKHIIIDLEREKFSISGSMLRHDLSQYWDMLTPPVKAHFAKRVCCIGVESSGTTTLAQNLAEHYQTVWIPEYGRWYSQGRRYLNDQWETHEFVKIADGQIRWEDDLAYQANRLVVCDTDALATHVWHKRYVGHFTPVVEAIADSRHYDLYLLTEPDFEFVQDGTRDGEHIRMEMHRWFIDELIRKNRPFIQVQGSRQNRIIQATQGIDKLLVFSKLEIV
jgi:HTH-type transcriptional regulator, transcriptional repressor of NAD biosynthesis genes